MQAQQEFKMPPRISLGDNSNGTTSPHDSVGNVTTHPVANRVSEALPDSSTHSPEVESVSKHTFLPSVSSHDEAPKTKPGGAGRKGQPWSEAEHLAFLAGLKKLGKGNWRGISRYYVQSRTPTQVASHAQKHFMRLNGVTKRKSRFSVLEQVAVSQGLLNANASLPASATPSQPETLTTLQEQQRSASSSMPFSGPYTSTVQMPTFYGALPVFPAFLAGQPVALVHTPAGLMNAAHIVPQPVTPGQIMPQMAFAHVNPVHCSQPAHPLNTSCSLTMSRENANTAKEGTQDPEGCKSCLHRPTATHVGPKQGDKVAEALASAASATNKEHWQGKPSQHSAFSLPALTMS
eukprot:CAMPEP_0177591496 /NCGR_PEP_ID=MMETSP0419_2-20121207/8029_1 /TAXON_ID=582737 /ORGANISM="Tetraselmis sp., Strain GSL018" /LENGTH=347 /DNA_ID=CAMNT_0019082243 /DNA_START=109 /DNA_END=1152 /DNA_ORIENTATION=-